jgi:adenosylhomocysteine nucleosidase
MGRARVGIVAALPEEIRPLQRRLQNTDQIVLRSGKALAGNLRDVPMVTLATGDGSERARSGLTELLTTIDLEVVFAIGIAGGLSADLQVGDVVVGQRVTNGTGEVPPPDSRLVAKAANLQDVRAGSIHSHSEIAIDPVAKHRLWERTGSQLAQVVDLETASYARVAAAHEVPYVALRAVSDSSEEALPLDFNRFRKPDGSSDRGGVIRYALRHPSILPELMQLRERLRHCANHLARLVEEILDR